MDTATRVQILDEADYISHKFTFHLDRRGNPVLLGVHFDGCLRARVSAYANDITVFVSRRLEIKFVKALARYEQIAGVKVNFDQSEGLRLGAWRGGVPLPGPFR